MAGTKEFMRIIGRKGGQAPRRPGCERNRPRQRQQPLTEFCDYWPRICAGNLAVKELPKHRIYFEDFSYWLIPWSPRGWQRFWRIECPGCGHLFKFLYRPVDHPVYRCRRCCRLKYFSQSLTAKERKLCQAQMRIKPS